MKNAKNVKNVKEIANVTVKESQKEINDDLLVNLDLNNLDAVLKKASEKVNTKVSNRTNKGLYKFVFAQTDSDKEFKLAKNHIKSLNFEKRNSSGQRSKVRKHLINLVTSYNQASEKDKQIFLLAFLKFYKDVYVTNDFTPESLVSLSNSNYTLIDTFLQNVRKFKIQGQTIEKVFQKIA